MNREILFRGKRVDTGEWVYGYYANCGRPYGKTNYTYHFIIEYPGNPKDYHKVYTTTIGQYTGLKDKNGTKIFEGDIMELASDGKMNDDGTKVQYIVRWGSSFAGFGLVEARTGSHDSTMKNWQRRRKNWVVAGNIHDNPEVVKQEEEPWDGQKR